MDVLAHIAITVFFWALIFGVDPLCFKIQCVSMVT